jgi:hypothetical protein
VIKLLRRIVFGSMSIGCSCLEFVALGSAFLCFGRVVEFDLFDGLISGVFDLGECSDIGACLHGFKVLGLRRRAIGLSCSFWKLGLGNLGCKDWLLAKSLD